MSLWYTSFDALQNGAKKVVAIDSDPECIKIAKQILGEDKSSVIEHDLTIPSSLKYLGFSKGEFNTVFYLAIHQHLAHRKPGSEENMLNEIIDLNPEYIVFRAKGFTEKISKMLTEKFGEMCFYSHVDKRLGPMMAYKNHNS